MKKDPKTATGNPSPAPQGKAGGSAFASMVVPSVMIPQGDGSVLVKPGALVEYLRPREFAKVVGCGRTTIYDQIGSPSIPERFVRRMGPKLIKIQAEGVQHFLDYWRDRRDGGILSGKLTPRASAGR